MGKIIFLAAFILIIAGCNSLPSPLSTDVGVSVAPASTTLGFRGEAETPIATAATPPTAIPTTTDHWFSLMLVTPYPWSTVVPPYRETLIDGNYAKFDPDEPQWWNCMRCEDFIPAGGVWKLSLEKGIYRIYYDVTEWRSLGSYSLDGNRIKLINDPHCRNGVGEYEWLLTEGVLTFEVVKDECAIGLRAANLTKQAWLSCDPPNVEAAITDHWVKPEGCAE
jgi:hypothetical protein